MKNLLSVLVILTIFIFACQKAPNCLNGRKYESGDCNCALGYEGINCDTLTISKFLGAYNLGNYPIQTGPYFAYQINLLEESEARDQVILRGSIKSNTLIVYDFIGKASGDHIVIPKQNLKSINKSLNDSLVIQGDACISRKDTNRYLTANLTIKYKDQTPTYKQYFWQRF